MTVFRLLLAICLALLAADLVFHRHTVHPAEELTGFYAFYGFVACVALVLLARVMRRFVMRSEDYWDD
jgi:hypothetical protein